MKIFNSRKTKIHRHVFLATLAIASIITSPRAQQPAATTQQPPQDRIALYQALLDLTNPWTVMCIAAHPDDEDGTSLIVMRRKYGAHTVSLFSTFGEGGQNAIGPELYEELGAIRARETMAAAEIQGSEAHFLGLKDFGYSKSFEETFQKWGHDEALRRMVLEIRKLRPDVIITNHSVTTNDHGHHQATARLVVEAFDAAADPNRFPEQLKDGVTTWQVQRLLVRARGQNPDRQGGSDQFVTIDPNERDPARGVVYAEEALRALQKHATQGPWPKTFAEFAARFRAFSGQNAAPGQLPPIRYVLVREAKGANALTKDSHNFLDGLRLPENVAKQLEPPMIDGKPLLDFVDQRDRVVSTLISAEKNSPYGAPVTLSRSHALSSDRRLSRMNEDLNNALALTLGIGARLGPNDPVLIPGTTANLRLSILNKGSRGAIAKRFWFGEQDGKTNAGTLMGPELPPNLLPGKTVTIPLTYDTPPNATLTVPRSQHLYDGMFAGKALTTGIFIDVGETSFPIVRNESLDVAPAIEIAEINPAPLVITSNTPTSSQSFTVTLANHQHTATNGKLGMSTNVFPGATFENGPSFTLAANETKKLELPVGKMLALQRNGQRTKPFTTGMIPLSIFVFKEGSRASSATRSAQVVSMDATVIPNLRVGYIRGFDYSLPNALAALGVESKQLGVDEVKIADLSKYTSIIVDNRVYESQPELIAANQKLLDYAKAGGNLIVFYHKSDEWNPDARRNRPQLAPYKLILGNERITDENAPVTFLEPDHPLLNVPNNMGQEDFKDWIQERGLYYPKEWDPQFHALLQSNDPGEAPLKGGLLVADYGKGHYIYSSMVWYRQLRAGVPGAYRMLANMISYGRTK